MIPAVNTAIRSEPLDLNDSNYNGRTYNLDYKDAVISGYTDNRDALTQSIYRMLTTERYQFPIYSDNYGIGLDDLYGKSIGLVKSELKRKITECLKTDDRVKDVGDFKFKKIRRGLYVEFTVYSTTEGAITFNREVMI